MKAFQMLMCPTLQTLQTKLPNVLVVPISKAIVRFNTHQQYPEILKNANIERQKQMVGYFHT